MLVLFKMPSVIRLAQYRIVGVTTRNADRHGKITFGDRTVPDFVTALALPDQRAAGVAQGLVELRRHLRRSRFSFAQCSDLKK